MEPKTIRRRAFRDVAERVVSVGLIVIPLVVLALWLAVHHKPDWYHPIMLDAQGMQRARRQALSTTDSISDHMVQREAFDIVLSDESVTQWIAALGSIWPDAQRRIPPDLTDIAVAFDEGIVRIGGRYRGSWHAIIHIHLKPGVTENGSKLSIQLLRVNSGSLPIPSSMIGRMLAKRIGAAVSGNEASNGQSEGVDRLLRWLGSPSELADGPSADVARREIENHFVWFNGRRPYRILSIQVAAGELRLRIEPL